MIFEKMSPLDFRSLALVRILLGFCIVIDLVVRASDLRAHYTDEGVLPRGALLGDLLHSRWYYSFHYISGEPIFQGLLFLLAGVVAVGLILGFRTRLCTIASWLLLVSLHARNPMVLNGGDTLLKMLLFWAMFLPLGRFWSVDSLYYERAEKVSYVSIAAFCFVLQLCIMYWADAAMKSDLVWKTDLSAVYYALSIDQFSTQFGAYILKYPEIMKVLTAMTIYLQLYGCFFLFIPFHNAVFRMIVILAFCGFHTGTAIIMKLGIFPYVCMIGWLTLLPPAFWNWLNQVGANRVRKGWGMAKVSVMIKDFLISRSVELRSGSACRHSALMKIFDVTRPAFLGGVMIYICMWNIREHDFDRFRGVFPASLNWFGQLLRIDQRWDMFAPAPLVDDGWYIIEAVKVNGEKVDLFRDGADVVWEKPERVSSMYSSQRWRKYMMNIWLAKNKGHRIYYGRYCTRSWNNTHEGGDRIERFEIIYMQEDTPPPGESSPDVKKVVIWNHICF